MDPVTIMSLAGLIVPGAWNFINKKFLKKESDTTEATVNTIATTSPEQVGPYLTAMSGWYETLTKWFNRDVIGTPSQWVIDLRASIRPLSVLASILIVAVDHWWALALDAGTRGALLMNISSWFGDRMAK